MSDLAQMIEGLSPDQREVLRAQLGGDDDDGAFTKGELSSIADELRKGMQAPPEYEETLAEAEEVDVSGFLGSLTEDLHKGYGLVHDSQQTLADGVALLINGFTDLQVEVAAMRSEQHAFVSEQTDLQKGLRAPVGRQSFETDVEVIEPNGNNVVDELASMNITQARSRIQKAMTDADPARRDQLSKAMTQLEAGGWFTKDTWTQLGLQ